MRKILNVTNACILSKRRSNAAHVVFRSLEMFIAMNWYLRTVEELDGCIVWNAHNTVLGEEALLIYIVPVCYVKTGRYGKT